MEGKYLRFSLGAESFGIDIIKIVEIIKLVPITNVPNTKDYIRGVINLRGSVVPVIDLRLKIGMDEKEPDGKTRIIIAENEIDGTVMRVGLLVDEVNIVCDVKAEEIDSVPSFDQKENSNYIMAVVKTKDSLYILLDLTVILTPEYKLVRKNI